MHVEYSSSQLAHADLQAGKLSKDHEVLVPCQGAELVATPPVCYRQSLWSLQPPGASGTPVPRVGEAQALGPGGEWAASYLRLEGENVHRQHDHAGERSVPACPHG